jgi:hypothetical protein
MVECLIVLTAPVRSADKLVASGSGNNQVDESVLLEVIRNERNTKFHFFNIIKAL